MNPKILMYSLGLLLMCFACTEPDLVPITDNQQSEDADQKPMNDWDYGPVTDCDELLSPFEMKEIWEMMNAKVYNENHICFEGYVLSNETYGDLVQGSIAFEPFSDEDVTIPSVYCQFTGVNGLSFLDYEIGEKIQIMGKLLCIDNPDKHNFMFAKCSLPDRNAE